jgi:hypothetical protein
LIDCARPLLLRVQSPELWNPVLISFYPTAAAASIAINAATLQTAFQQAGAEPFAAALQGIWGFGMPKTPASWGYSVAILLYLATGTFLANEHVTPVAMRPSTCLEAYHLLEICQVADL